MALTYWVNMAYTIISHFHMILGSGHATEWLYVPCELYTGVNITSCAQRKPENEQRGPEQNCSPASHP